MGAPRRRGGPFETPVMAPRDARWASALGLRALPRHPGSAAFILLSGTFCNSRSPRKGSAPRLLVEGVCLPRNPRRRLRPTASRELGQQSLSRCLLTPLPPPGYCFVGERFLHSLLILPESKIFLGNPYRHFPLSPTAELVRLPSVRWQTVFQAFYTHVFNFHE